MQPFFDYLTTLHAKTCSIDDREKILLSREILTKPASLKMSQETFEELVHLFCKENTQILETIEYFTRHAEKLNDPDYQLIFQKLFFTEGVLHKAARITRMTTMIYTLLKRNFERFKGENEIQASIFMLQMMRNMETFRIEMPLNQEQRLDHLRTLLRGELDTDERSVVYGELVAQLSKKERLEVEDIRDLLSGLAYLESYPVPLRWTDSTTELAVREAPHLHAKQIEAVLLSHPNLANEILKSIVPEHGDVIWTIKQNDRGFPTFISVNEMYEYYPLQGLFLTKNKETTLPLEIQENPIFRQLYSGISKGLCLEVNFFSFIDKNGFKTLVRIDGDTLTIDQCSSKNEWKRFIPSNKFFAQDEKGKTYSSLSSFWLTKHFDRWQSLNDPSQMTLVNSTTGRAEYTVKIVQDKDKLKILSDGSKDFQERIEEVKRLSDGAILGTTSALLAQFENLGYVHEWYDLASKKLKQIELPRFDLSFTATGQTEQHLQCDQFSGFYLKPDAVIPKLGSYSYYLVLQNSKGEQKVILPYQQFNSVDEPEILLPRFAINRQMNHKEQKYLVYEVKKKGMLSSPSRVANLYLAEVLTLVQEYKKAAFYLKKYGAKLSPYSKEEKQVLTNLPS